MQLWQILLIILAGVAGVLIFLYLMGRRSQRKQAENQDKIDAAKQVTSLLVIDKKMLSVKKSGLPQVAIDQTPWYLRWQKLPIVKAKVGPKVVTLAADKGVWDVLPLMQECKVEIAGIYISSIKSVRGGSIPVAPKKRSIMDRIFHRNADQPGAPAKAKKAEKQSKPKVERAAEAPKPAVKEEPVRTETAAETVTEAAAEASANKPFQTAGTAKKGGKKGKNKHRGHSGDPNRGKK